jgi:GAF domain-containing protein
MLAQGHRFEVGGRSMVGQCIAHGRARIALEAGEEALRFDNPLLPHTRSELALPLVSREKPIGAMTIQSVEPGAFGTQDVAALQLMADQLANAIETARLYARTQEALYRTQALYETSRALSSAQGEASVLRAVLAGLSRQPGCLYAVLFGIDPHAAGFEILGSTWRGQCDALPSWLAYPRSFQQDGLLLEVCRSGTMATVDGWDDRIDPRHYQDSDLRDAVRIVAPLRRRGESIGVAEVGYVAAASGALGAQRIEWLAAILGQGTVALENARLWTDTQRSLEDAECMYQASQGIAVADSAEELLHAVLEGAGPHAADCVILWTSQGRTAEGVPILASVAVGGSANEVPPWPVGIRLAATELSPLWASGRPDGVYVPDLEQDVACLAEEASRALAGWGARTTALVPVLSGERMLGALQLAGREPRRFAPRDVRRIESLAGQLAVGIERLQLLEQLQERLQREQILRGVSERIRSAIDVDCVMRTTAEEVGLLLRRPAFFRLNGDTSKTVSWEPEEEQGEC